MQESVPNPAMPVNVPKLITSSADTYMLSVQAFAGAIGVLAVNHVEDTGKILTKKSPSFSLSRHRMARVNWKANH